MAGRTGSQGKAGKDAEKSGEKRPDVKREEKRVNIELDDELHRQAKALAVLKGVPLSEFVQTAIADAVGRDIGLIAETARPLKTAGVGREAGGRAGNAGKRGDEK
jgi:Arc/MetJ family transcription regulator